MVEVVKEAALIRLVQVVQVVVVVDLHQGFQMLVAQALQVKVTLAVIIVNQHHIMELVVVVVQELWVKVELVVLAVTVALARLLQ